MIVLALDTSLGAVSVALANADGVRIAHRRELRENGHAERLFPLLGEVTAEAGVALRDVGRVAVTLGPGTFTGVRTGVAAARALVLATGCEAVGETSLAVIARGVRRLRPEACAGRELLVAIDARRGQAYVQRFGAGGEALSEPELCAVEAVAAGLSGAAVTVAGSGAGPIVAAAVAVGGAPALLPGVFEPDALDLLHMAPDLVPLEVVRPLYIRPPDAKPPANPAVARA